MDEKKTPPNIKKNFDGINHLLAEMRQGPANVSKIDDASAQATEPIENQFQEQDLLSNNGITIPPNQDRNLISKNSRNNGQMMKQLTKYNSVPNVLPEQHIILCPRNQSYYPGFCALSLVVVTVGSYHYMVTRCYNWTGDRYCNFSNTDSNQNTYYFYKHPPCFYLAHMWQISIPSYLIISLSIFVCGYFRHPTSSLNGKNHSSMNQLALWFYVSICLVFVAKTIFPEYYYENEKNQYYEKDYRYWEERQLKTDAWTSELSEYGNKFDIIHKIIVILWGALTLVYQIGHTVITYIDYVYPETIEASTAIYVVVGLEFIINIMSVLFRILSQIPWFQTHIWDWINVGLFLLYFVTVAILTMLPAPLSNMRKTY